MTAASIPASTGADYAEYLDGKTVAPEQGDYYLGRDGLPTEAPGRWLGDPHALGRVGVAPGPVAAEELRALMAGRCPGQPENFLRAAGPDGTRAAGIDVTFSAPKSVSIAWALGDPDQRAEIEQAHRAAVEQAVGYLAEMVPLTARWDPALGSSTPAKAAHVHAAEFLHTTARGVGDGAPDPQIHSHVVITSVERDDGTVTAVRSRPVLRVAREGGAFYRAQLADHLRHLGYAIDPAGVNGRYFRIRGVEEQVEAAFSRRTAEVQQAARAFRAEHGRAPERGELRALAIATRSSKIPHTRHELDASWQATAAPHGLDTGRAARLRSASAPASAETANWATTVERNVTAKRATFDEPELRTVALEAAAGHGLAAQDALDATDALRRSGRVLDLADGRMTSATVRAAETAIETNLTAMAADQRRRIEPRARAVGITAVEQRIGAPLSDEQRAAIERITGPGRAAVLVGPAGTGKGLVIDAAAHAEQAAGRRVYGVAVAGRTAQRLGESAPALVGRVKTIDGFIAAAERGRLQLDADTTVYVDEAGMGDTDRLHRLTKLIAEHGGALVAIGDPRQLPAIGAGGMFERLTHHLPTAELHTIHRASDPAERDAWQALRNGNADAALAFYRDRGHLHLTDTRDEALEAAAHRYDQLAAEHGHHQVALMSDASNTEIDHLNLRIQALRRGRSELSTHGVEHPAGYQLCAGDRVIWTESMPARDGGARVENGQRGAIETIDRERLAVRLDGGNRLVQLDAHQLGAVRLGYATHVVREQGATVRRSVVVTGGWQTSQETAYVESTRATNGVDWHLAREDLDGADDTDRLRQLSARMSASRAQAPSLAAELDDPVRAPSDPVDDLRVARLAPQPSRRPTLPTPNHAIERDR
ncbi:MobF family relaxase [Conexibacter stalactiti]|uniref:MobF family relaxase n=1 Tax=Conexibacter stalactiti TaxID=1940611 RepID=A0ABU4HRJ1_9ACTN|nr:MobF family relaxase [Conexibacter stalactiti]MDW5595926.1 MobF family relaxase [Conexibacter stalactiti]MEC5036568.1 MobF family relaxase [Conexibacter stalactiti]